MEGAESGLLKMVLTATARHWVGFAAAWLVAHGFLAAGTDENAFLRIGVGVVVGLCMWGWSIYQKVDHAAVIAQLKDRVLPRR